MKKEAYSKNKRISHFNVLDALIIILIIAMVVGIYFRFNVVDHSSGMKEQKEYVISFSVDDIRATTAEFIKVGDQFYLENEELFGTLISESEGSASSLNITPALKLFTDSNLDIFTDIMLTAAEHGLGNVQFNIVDADTLIDAQKHPEKYNNLAVRVSGFSQKFNLLDKNLQNHIIGRTKHATI
jgi:autonomous glycyl radical cofactor GrcA